MNSTVIIFIVLSSLVAIGCFAISFYKIKMEHHKKQKLEHERRQEEQGKERIRIEKQEALDRFSEMINDSDFNVEKKYDDFLFDVGNKKWCKVGILHIFDVKETLKATVYKKKACRTYRGRTYDTSKYEVYIETKNIDIPIVKSVGLTQETAEKIKATINIICDKK